jgi:hypothetical protein
MPTFNPDKERMKKGDYPVRQPSSPSTMFFDIETEGREDAQMFMPAFAPRANIKDPEKIKADLAEKQAAWSEKLALSPITGRVLAIGYCYGLDDEVKFREGDEKAMVENFLEECKAVINRGGKVIGFNILGFDLPFLARRAWALGLTVPIALYEVSRGGFHWSYGFHDLMKTWLAGDREFSGNGLGAVCKLLGLGEKTESGKNFSNLYQSDKEQALEYLRHDVDLTRKLAARIGAI